MPFIKADISVKLSRDQKRDLYKALGEHITCFAGKSEHGLMTEICDECFMSHGGEAHPAIACFQVKLFGKQEFILSMSTRPPGGITTRIPERRSGVPKEEDERRCVPGVRAGVLSRAEERRGMTCTKGGRV